ncbi:hypothetical protein ACJX0J_024305, partial [Zea mays]
VVIYMFFFAVEAVAIEDKQMEYEMEEPQNGSETAVGDLYSDEQEQPLTEYNGCSEVNEFETGVDNLDRDEQERLLAENNSCSEVRYETTASQTEADEHARDDTSNAEDNHLPEDGHGLMNMVAHISDNCHMNNEKMLLKQNMDKLELMGKQFIEKVAVNADAQISHQAKHCDWQVKKQPNASNLSLWIELWLWMLHDLPNDKKKKLPWAKRKKPKTLSPNKGRYYQLL